MPIKHHQCQLTKVSAFLFKKQKSSHGAKVDVNQQKIVNINPRTLEEYFYESCIIPEGDDIDDEDFRIRINFKLFEKPAFTDKEHLEVTKDRANAWAVQLDTKVKPVNNSTPSTGKVDTRRLEYFSEVDSLRYLLRHPLMTSFLEMELNSLKIRYFLDFLLYLIFVTFLFTHLGNRYGVFEGNVFIMKRNFFPTWKKRNLFLSKVQPASDYQPLVHWPLGFPKPSRCKFKN